MAEDNDHRPHLFLSNTASPEHFSTPSSGDRSKKAMPERNRQQHASRLSHQLDTIKTTAQELRYEQTEAGIESGFGIRIQFESLEDIDMPFESLARDRQGIELLNVKKDESHIYATIFVPEGKLSHFETLIKQYLEEIDNRSGKPKHQALINTIEQIHTAAFDELWTDDLDSLPQNDNESIWWEAWLPVRDDRPATVSAFKHHARLAGLEVSDSQIEFPERTVIAVRATTAQMKQSVTLLNSIAEIRRAKETAEFFGEMNLADQQEWTDEAMSRIDPPENDAVAICILDTGINHGHSLLAVGIDDGDLHSVEPNWSLDDEDGHGTGMGGLALYGDLTDFLEHNKHVRLVHRLESVKLLRKDGDNVEKLHGNLTREGIARAEIVAPQRQRIICSAITAKDGRDRGRPSTWSAALDALTSGADDDEFRLIFTSAGNVSQEYWVDYPSSNSTDSIHDPGQAWNALTVGAYTQKDILAIDAGPDYETLAPHGGLSPFSTTSRTWPRPWPLKPDIIFEGGNAAKDPIGAVWMGSLSLLTTHHQPLVRLFAYFNATSASTALAARMAAQIKAFYPKLWPETIRALMVHSAQWTQTMMKQFLDNRLRAIDYEHLIRHCGFGVPNLESALWSADNALTLVAEDTLQPFEKEKGKSPKTKEMNLHAIPWPIEALETLGDQEVQMRVTLSYFIEPNPAERGFSRRYRYESHGLRFDVKKPEETVDQFRGRINRAALDEGVGTASKGDGGGWTLGKQLRHLGSIHSDIWQGTATDLANRGFIAVYPTLGWWRERPKLERYNKIARYALIISIHTPETDIDIYNEVAAKVEVPVEIGT